MYFMGNLYQHTLPKKRRKSLIENVDSLSKRKLILLGIGSYALIILVTSVLEILLQNEKNYLRASDSEDHLFVFCDYLYFNSITILTIGYGDYSPNGIFRVFSIIEAIAGLGIFSVFISLITLKSLLPRKNSIVFSKYAYYSLNEKRFMVIYLNTTNDFIINVETCSYVKIGGDWKVKQAVKSPFITKSVQTFFLDEIPEETLKMNNTNYDCLRIGISGSLGIADYSTAIEYNFENIWVIQNRELLSNYSGFWEVDQNLGKEEFEKYFHYRPENAVNLQTFLTT